MNYESDTIFFSVGKHKNAARAGGAQGLQQEGGAKRWTCANG